MQPVTEKLIKELEELFLASLICHERQKGEMNIRMSLYDPPTSKVIAWLAFQMAPKEGSGSFRLETRDLGNSFAQCDIDVHTSLLKERGEKSGPVVRISGIRERHFVTCDIYLQPTVLD